MDTRKKFMAVFIGCFILSAGVFLVGIGAFETPTESTENPLAVDSTVTDSTVSTSSTVAPALGAEEPNPVFTLEEVLVIVGGIAGMISSILGTRAYELDLVTERRSMMIHE